MTAPQEESGLPVERGPADPDAIKADIEATREQLGRTVEELSRRLDVPARAREQVTRVREAALDEYLKNPPAVVGAGLVLVASVVGVIIWRRKRAVARGTSRRKR